MIVDYREVNFISYITPMNSRSGVENSIFVYFMIDTNEINRIMNAESDINSTIYVTDAQNAVLYASDDILKADIFASLDGKNGFIETLIADKNSIIVYTVSDFNNWKYITVIPSGDVLSEANALMRFFTFLFIAAIITTLLVAGFFSRKAERPVSSLLSMVSKNISGDISPNVFDTIGVGVSNLLGVKEDMESKLAQQEKTLEALYVERLLNNGASQMVDFLSETRNPLAAFDRIDMSVIVLLIHCGYIETALFTQALDIACKRAISLHPDIDIYTHILADNEVALIVGNVADQSVFEHNVATFTGDIINGFSDDLRVTLHIAAGGVYNGIEQLGESLEQARYTLKYMFATNEGALLWYRDIGAESQKFYYPIDIERHIINNVRAGNNSGLILIQEMLYKANFVDVNLSIGMKKCFLYNYYCTYIKTVEYAEGTLTAANIEFLNTIEIHASDYKSIFDDLSGRLRSLANQYASSKKSHNDELIQNILGYIGGNYHIWDLQIESVAKTFNISKPYLSNFFKEQTGETFSAYLEKIRIDNACNMLACGNTVSVAAEKVGYTNTYTFRRAFRRVTGLLPTEFKGSQK